MVPYYILNIEKFNIDLPSYGTQAQCGLDGILDDGPHTYFEKHATQILDGYTKYDLTCETIYKHKGRAYGYADTFEQFILISNKSFYYSHQLNILIMSTSKDVFQKFYTDFGKDQVFQFKKVEVNFLGIINNRHSLGIEGIWLGKLPDVNINALLFLGSKIENSSQYQQLIATGAEITNMSIIYNFNGNQEKIMITKDGGIILYHRKDESDALLLIEDVYRKLLIP